MQKLKLGQCITITIDDEEIIGQVNGISTRENSKEFVTYYYFDIIHDGPNEIKFSLDITEEKDEEE